VSPAACPRCASALGLSRWCQACGFDLRPDLPTPDIHEARVAAAQQQRWLAAHPGAGEAPAPEGFLPPAGASAPPLGATAGAGPFAPLRLRSLLAVRWLSFAIVLGLAALTIDGLWLQEQSTSDWTVDDMISLGKLMDATSIVQLVAYLIGAIIFIVWFHRAYGNLAVLGVQRPRHGRGWAIGGWFVPFANIFLPKQLANDVWRAGDPELRPGDPAWQTRPVAPVLHWWWAFWLLSNGAAGLAGNLMADAETLEAFRGAVIADAISQVLGIVSALAAIVVVKRATARQEARARLLAAPGAAVLA
jgi:uncharacterized protein DUF4328